VSFSNTPWQGVKARSYLYRAENPKNQRLNDVESSRSYAKGEVDADVLAHLWVTAVALINF